MVYRWRFRPIWINGIKDLVDLLRARLDMSDRRIAI